MWCNDTSFKFLPSTMASNSLRLAMLRWPSLSCQSIAPSSKEFAMCVVSLHTFTLKRYKFLSLHVSATTTPPASLTLQPSLSNYTLKPLEMSLLTKMRLFFIFGTWRTWAMVVCVNSPPIYIMALMFPLLMTSKTVSSPMNTLLGEMRSYMVNHYYWNAMCCIAPKSTIHSYVVWSLAFNAPTNIYSWSSQAWLVFFFHHFSSLNNFSQNVQVSYNKNKAFHLTCEFCWVMQ